MLQNLGSHLAAGTCQESRACEENDGIHSAEHHWRVQRVAASWSNDFAGSDRSPRKKEEN